MRLLLVLLLLAGTAQAERHARGRGAVRTRDELEKARAALAVIDGANWIADLPVQGSRPGSRWHPSGAVGEQLPRGEGYLVRRPERAYGASHVIDHVEHSIAEVRALYPDVHTLAIGDLSSEHGGKLADHLSHRTGLDVDVGFYFHHVPDGYPDHFAAADGDLDLEATWALLTAFARTSDLDDGVEMMFLDYAVQRRLYLWATARGTPESDLDQLFQFPRGKNAQVGVIRHWPNHVDHVHVRFKSRR